MTTQSCIAIIAKYLPATNTKAGRVSLTTTEGGDQWSRRRVFGYDYGQAGLAGNAENWLKAVGIEPETCARIGPDVYLFAVRRVDWALVEKQFSKQ